MGDTIAENVAWSYEQLPEPVASLKNLVAFYRDDVTITHEEPGQSA